MALNLCWVRASWPFHDAFAQIFPQPHQYHSADSTLGMPDSISSLVHEYWLADEFLTVILLVHTHGE